LSDSYTVGICVSENTSKIHLTTALSSILIAKMKSGAEVEVILCGNTLPIIRSVVNSFSGALDILIIPFDEKEKKKPWITRKKNLIVQHARMENTILMHDYYCLACNFFDPNPDDYGALRQPVVWSKAPLENYWFRHSDWIVNPNRMQEFIDASPGVAEELKKAAPEENAAKYVCGLPYDESACSSIQYISGGFMFARTHVFLECPLNEDLLWGEAEDVEWSERVLKRFILKFYHSCVYSMKPNKWNVTQMPDSVLEKLKAYYNL
jgi:hypothetical protein